MPSGVCAAATTLETLLGVAPGVAVRGAAAAPPLELEVALGMGAIGFW